MIGSLNSTEGEARPSSSKENYITLPNKDKNPDKEGIRVCLRRDFINFILYVLEYIFCGAYIVVGGHDRISLILHLITGFKYIGHIHFHVCFRI